MSDTYAAPAPASSPAPAASVNEVPVNPNPVSAPTPIGPQTPNKSADDIPQSRHAARKEAVDKAFERTIGPAKPRMGHNNPPEPMQKERNPNDNKPPLNLRQKPPADTPGPSVPGAQRERGEHGHFAPRGQQSGQQPDNRTPYNQPLKRMSELAKREWHQAPESVRADVHRIAKEHRDFKARANSVVPFLNSIRPYHEMAKQHGTTLQQALHNYTGIEAKLREDPIGGLEVIVNNLNLRTQDGRRLSFRDIANYVAMQSPEQHRAVQVQNHQTALQQQLARQQAMINQLVQYQHHVHYQQQFMHTRGAVDRFAETHPRLDELGDLIEQELKLGFDLPMAYRRAELLRPGPHAAQTRPQATQTRQQSDRSIHGAPDSGPRGNGVTRSSRPVSRSEAFDNAFRHVSGSL